MKSILCLATVCLFALASAAVIPPEQSPDQFSSLGLIKVPEAFLLKPVQALLKIYVVSPLNGQKLQLPLDASQLANTAYIEVSQQTSDVTSNPQFPHTALGPSNQLFSLSSNVVIEIWDEQQQEFVGGSILTFAQAKQQPSQMLTLLDSTNTLAGVAQQVYVPPADV
ncbi:hypothetical protein TYRP_011919 [Tyrophagus putrescentiae]|nr:hypothetical protein TYRP_011919 [Tyrophagus putrescentiae]